MSISHNNIVAFYSGNDPKLERLHKCNEDCAWTCDFECGATQCQGDLWFRANKVVWEGQTFSVCVGCFLKEAEKVSA